MTSGAGEPAARRFDAVLFDAGGVLVVPNPGPIGAVLARFGVTAGEDQIVRAHYAAMRAQDVHSQAYADWDVYRAAFVARFGLGDEAAGALGDIWDPFLWDHPLADSVAALRALHERGVALGVVSNASGQIEGVLAERLVCQVGEGAGVPMLVVIDSEVVGVSKPDPAIFTFALDVLGTSPGRTAYVGDSVYNDVGGATAAGLVPLHLDPHDDHPDAPHERIRSLFDLLGFVAPAP